jgi:predicted nuclease of predicted toxin-antitoxin system
MKVLLDECVTRHLKRDFTGHEALTVDEAGFKGLKNGQLLQAASGQYDVLVTVDQNISAEPEGVRHRHHCAQS